MWHYTEAGQAVGPLEEHAISEMIASGRITADTMLWEAGTPQWVPAASTRMWPVSPLNVPPLPRVTHAPVQAEPKKKKPIEWVITIAAFAFGFWAMRNFSMQMQARILGGSIMGALCGLIPYFAGRNRNRKLAKTAVTVCVLCGMVLGIILALPAAITFTIILRTQEPKDAVLY